MAQISENIWNSLKHIQHLGDGTFGTAVLVQDTSDGSHYVKKTVKRRSNQYDNEIRTLIRTRVDPYTLGKDACLPNLICMSYWRQTKDTFEFLMYTERTVMCDLHTYVDQLQHDTHSRRSISLHLVRIMIQLSIGVSQLHRRNISHRDIKPENAVIAPAPTLDIRLIDYGAACTTENNQGGYTCDAMGVGTRGYMSPEMVHDRNHDPLASDIYALGATFFFLFSTKYMDEYADQRLNDSYMRTLIEKMTSEDPVERPNIKSVVRSLMRYKMHMSEGHDYGRPLADAIQIMAAEKQN